MALPDVARGDPHVAAHNAERDLINSLQDLSDPAFLAALLDEIGDMAFDPNDVGYDVIVSMGQSNEKGVNDGPDTTFFEVPDPRIKQYAASGPYAGKIISAIEPLYHIDGSHSGIGHVAGFAHELLKQTKPNRSICIIPYAWPSTGFSTSSLSSPPAGYTGDKGGSWDPSAGSGGVDLLGGAIAYTNAFLAANPNSRVVAFSWLQGEADQTNLGTEALYGPKLDAMIDRVRSEIATASEAVFIAGQMVPEGIGSGGRAAINKSHIDLPRRKLLTAFAYGPVGYDGGSALHYINTGQRLLVPEYLKGYNRGKKNVLGVLPDPVTSLVAVQSGTSILASWVRPYSRVTEFQVKYRIGAGTWVLVNTSASPLEKTATIPGFSVGDAVTVQVVALNEEGASSAVVSSSVTVVDYPAQVGTVTAGSATASTQPLSWAALPNTTSYLVEYKKAADSVWLSSGVVTTNAATVRGLLASTSYNYRVTASNARGAGTSSATTTASTSALGTLLGDMNVTSGATVFYAYGLRKLRSAYAGSAIRVRRASDSTEQDIGFSGNNLDTAALLTFCAGTDGFVKILYDQSTNGLNFTLSTTTQQPKIVSAGALITVGGKPIVQLNGTTHGGSDSTAGAVGLYNYGSMTYLDVCRIPSAGSGFSAVFCEGSAANAQFYLFGGSANVAMKNFFNIKDDAGLDPLVAGVTGASLTTTLHARSNRDSGFDVVEFMDGVKATLKASYDRTGSTMNLTTFRNWGFLSSARSPVDWCESVIFKGALSDAEVLAGQANQKDYYGL